jgi:hypothetical protein
LLLGLFFLLTSTTPERLSDILLFYAVIAGLTFSLTTLIAFYLRKLFGRRELLNYYYKLSVRQGIWFTILVLSSLYLLTQGLFNWINTGLIILTLVFLEGYLLTKNDREY